MLHEFLRANASELTERCRLKAGERRGPRAIPSGLEHGIPLFIEQLAGMLAGAAAEPAHALPREPRAPAESRIKESATLHGRELLRHDFTIDQVVHDYGDLCQAITEMAVEKDIPITVLEFGVLNIRLDNAIAGAVTEYTRQHDAFTAKHEEFAFQFAHEMRNLLNTAILAVSAIREGSVGLNGATAAALDRSLTSARRLTERAIQELEHEPGDPGD